MKFSNRLDQQSTIPNIVCLQGCPCKYTTLGIVAKAVLTSVPFSLFTVIPLGDGKALLVFKSLAVQLPSVFLSSFRSFQNPTNCFLRNSGSSI